MGQAKANQIRIRELDQDGNPADPATHPHDSPDPAGREVGNAAINPFIIVLWVFACLLAGGGVWVYTDVNSVPGNMYGPPGTMPVSFALMSLAPHAVLIGMLTMMCLLFWHAWQWRRRH